MYSTPLVECSLYDVKRHGDVSSVVWLSGCSVYSQLSAV